MKMNWSIKLLPVLALFAFAVTGCKKEDALTIPDSQATFTNKSSGSYTITAPNVIFKVPVGVTAASDRDRTIKISVTSTTGAVQGTQYTLSTTTVTIPAGKVVDSFEVRGVYSQYLAGRRDTLVFTLQEQDVPVSSFNQTYTLALRGPCFEGNVVLGDLTGQFANTNEDWGGSLYGPYTTSVTATPLTATTANITVSNIFDAGWAPITFKLDWTNPNARTVTLVQQDNIADASTAFGASAAGLQISVRPYAGQVGTFSACNQTIVLKMQIGVPGANYWDADLYTVTLRK